MTFLTASLAWAGGPEAVCEKLQRRGLDSAGRRRESG